MDISGILKQTIVQFCTEFMAQPYLCYTEHGQHALFYTRLYNALPPAQRYTTWQGQKVGVVQKEYRTAGNLGKSRRQHWDIAVIDTPPQSIAPKRFSYDYLKLAGVVEFGLNATKEHLLDDLDRLCHPEANVKNKFIVHLYRLSPARGLFSQHDWSPNSARVLIPTEVGRLSVNKPVEIYYGLADSTGEYENGVWHIVQGQIARLG